MVRRLQVDRYGVVEPVNVKPKRKRSPWQAIKRLQERAKSFQAQINTIRNELSNHTFREF